MESIVFPCLLVLVFVSSIEFDSTFKSNVNVNQYKELKSGEYTEQLKNAYQKLSSSPSKLEYQQEYFDFFPSTFTTFNNLFGYSNNDPWGNSINDFSSPLYNEAETYIFTFFSLDRIDKVLFYNRIINISINGRWYADGVNYFKHNLEDTIKKNKDYFFTILSKRSDKEIKSFWYFYFDGPHPINTFPTEFDEVKVKDTRMYTLMVESLKSVNQNMLKEK